MNPFKSKSVRAATAISLILAVAACGGQSESEEKAAESANSSQETSAPETAEEALSAAEEEAAEAIENAEPDPDDMMKAASETAEAASAKLANLTNDAVATGDSMIQAAVMETTETAELIQAAADETSAVVNGDAVAGKRAFVKCMACHTVNEGQHRVGPSLYGIVGKTAGTVEGFRTYSPANKNSGVTWTPEVLFEYLENPQQFMPGTRMVFPGIPSEKERNDLIAYLQSASE